MPSPDVTVVAHLRPGDQTTHATGTATYITQTQHPIWPRLQLVIWRMNDGTWSHDALSPAQEVGCLTPSTRAERWTRLQAALLDEVDRG